MLTWADSILCVWLCAKFPTLLYPFTFTPVPGSSSLKVGNQKLWEVGKCTPSLTARRCCGLSAREGRPTPTLPPSAISQGRPRRVTARPQVKAYPPSKPNKYAAWSSSPRPNPAHSIYSAHKYLGHPNEVLVSLQSDKEESLHKVRVCAQRTHEPWDSGTVILMLCYGQCQRPLAYQAWEASMCMKVFLAEPLGTVGSGLRAYSTSWKHLSVF